MRRALGVDLDLRAFHERYRFDPLIGPSVRANPRLRPSARPDPFEALCVRGLRAADRVRAGGGDPAADDRAARTP